MKKCIFIKFAFIFLFFCITLSAFGQEKHEEYCNQKFSYCIFIPASLLHPKPDLAQVEGREWKAKKGDAKVYVLARKAEDAIEPSQGFKSVYTGITYSKEVTYEVVKKDWFVVSGYTEDGNVFYAKVILRNKVVYYVHLEYPKSERKTWDSQCGKIANSLIIK